MGRKAKGKKKRGLMVMESKLEKEGKERKEKKRKEQIGAERKEREKKNEEEAREAKANGSGGFLNLYFYLILCYSGVFFMVLAHDREEF